MAYSKAKLKSSGDRASPCFKPFLIGNLSDTFLPTRTLLYVSVRLIFIKQGGRLPHEIKIGHLREPVHAQLSQYTDTHNEAENENVFYEKSRPPVRRKVPYSTGAGGYSCGE